MDNHDTPRFSEQMGYDMNKYKIAVAHLLTTRGIPQIYYGTEILMGGKKQVGDGDIRRDFPGGWPGDTRNAFAASGRTDKENEAFNYLRTLLNYRKNNPVLHNGKMIHFIPRDNVYVYFRMNETKTVMVLLNLSTEKRNPDMARFAACMKGAETGKDIITGKTIELGSLMLKGQSSAIIELALPGDGR